jgi:hypothetical protein
VTDPGPVRPVPFWNVRKLVVLVALHAQPLCVLTLMLPVAAAAETLVLAGLIEYVHGTVVGEIVNWIGSEYGPTCVALYAWTTAQYVPPAARPLKRNDVLLPASAELG